MCNLGRIKQFCSAVSKTCSIVFLAANKKPSLAGWAFAF
jgi:hypothetical protein